MMILSTYGFYTFWLAWIDFISPYCSIKFVFLVSALKTNTNTVGANKNCTLVFVNSSAQDASILKISWGFQNTPNL